MNKNKLISLTHKISEKTEIPFNSILTFFFMESLLKRISKSKYRNNFVFKGGFLLSSILGASNRTTIDIDMLFKNMSFNERAILKIISEIIDLDLYDNVQYKLGNIEQIRNEDEYGGYRIKITCNFENIKQVIPLDIAVGDPITPSSINYKYLTLYDNDEISIISYNIETILAEKLHTVYVRGVLNSRNKDFYDIYIIMKLKKSEINNIYLKEALYNTFNHRKATFDINKIKEVLNIISSNETMINRWKKYSKKFSFARNIEFNEVIRSCYSLLSLINK